MQRWIQDGVYLLKQVTSAVNFCTSSMAVLKCAPGTTLKYSIWKILIEKNLQMKVLAYSQSFITGFNWFRKVKHNKIYFRGRDFTCMPDRTLKQMGTPNQSARPIETQLKTLIFVIYYLHHKFLQWGFYSLNVV